MSGRLRVSYFILLGPAFLLAATSQETLHNWKEMSHYYLEQTYKTYSNCVIHILDLKGDLALPPSNEVPIVINVLPNQLQTLQKLHFKSTEFQHGLDAILNQHLRKASAVPNIKNFNCFVTFIAVLNFQTLSSFNEISRTGNEYSRAVVLWTIMRQDVTLGLETPWVNSTGMWKYFDNYPKYFPESVIMLNMDFKFAASEANNKLTMVDRMLFHSSAHLPTILMILIQRKNASAQCKSALIFCMYCNDAQRFVPLDCPSAIGTAELTISRYVNQVPWIDFGAWPWNPKTELCPLTLSVKDSERCSAEKLNVASIALSGLNLSEITRQPEFIGEANQRIPKLYLTAQHSTAQRPDVAAPVENSQYGLITSDCLLEENQGTNFGSLIKPFNLSVWTAVCLTATAVAFSISGMRFNCMHLRILALSMLSTCLILLEQFQNVSTTPNEVPGRTNTLINGVKIRCVSAVWLITAFLITNWYKAEFKSKYLFDPVYTRNWTRAMIDMDDFTFYVAFGDESIAADFGHELKEGYYFASADCKNHALPRKSRLVSDPRDPCGLFQDYTNMKWVEINRHFSGEVRNEMLTVVQDRIRLVPLSLIKNVIRTILLKSKTAFVSPLHLFDSDWNYFQQAMRSDRKMKFTRFHDSENRTTLKSYKMYG